ncbi:hypothetical protein [Methylovirgula ligni]|uniref:hypothetical protein n=1 Tax=Methylovirgula ligni TaxID=569860 RepID=UPI0011C057C7|nr:hypothetical protein [Methylovirgula ligni]
MSSSGRRVQRKPAIRSRSTENDRPPQAAADPLRALLDLIVERLRRSKAVLSELRLGKAEKD